MGLAGSDQKKPECTAAATKFAITHGMRANSDASYLRGHRGIELLQSPEKALHAKGSCSCRADRTKMWKVSPCISCAAAAAESQRSGIGKLMKAAHIAAMPAARGFNNVVFCASTQVAKS